MKQWRVLICFLSCLCAFDLSANPDFALAPHLTDGMVVQAGSDTVFYGIAPPGARVRIEVKGRRFSGGRFSAHKETGTWSKPVNLGSASTQPLEIEFYLGEEKTPIRTLRDVLVGEVWIAAIELGEGIPAGPQLAAPNLRFVKYEGPQPAPGVQIAPWRVADEEGLAQGQFDLLAYKLAREVADKRGVPVGIIHVKGTELTAALRGVPAPAFGDLGDAMIQIRKAAYDDTYAAIQARNTRLRANKRLGIVTIDPPIYLYKKYRLYTPSQLQRTDFFAPLSFRGVIGPDPSGD